jgi:hypothetical protein
VNTKDSKVESISFGGTKQDTIANIIDWLGPPEGIYAKHVGPEDVSLVIYLFYPSKGAWYIAEGKPQPGLPAVDRILGEMTISQAFYTVPGTIESVLANGQQSPGYINCVLSNLQSWNGYGAMHVNKSCP